jgi:DNA-binding response OmpR family regulator
MSIQWQRPRDACAASGPSATAGASVLLVDDDPGVLLTLGRYLEDCGYRVATADSAMVALQMLDRAAYDLMVIDCVMPEGTLRGTALGRMIRRRQPSARIIFISAQANIAEVDGELPGPFIRKPFAFATLDAAISDLFLLQPPAADDQGAIVRG